MILARAVSTPIRFQLMMRGKHDLPKLSYDYNALEPIICREIMELHHQKHHQTYVNNLNAGEEQLQEAVHKNDVTKIVSLGNALKFNGGGHINHTIFWQNLSPEKSEPSKELKEAIEKQFKSFDNFKKELTALTVGVQGSGWGWLGYNKKNGKLQLVACANQDPLEATTGLIPLFGIDVWEHAYYLQYKNVRPSYVEAIFEIANWKDVSNRFLHHQKHHQTYVNNLNAGEEQLQEAVHKNDVTKIVSLGNALKFNGGGHINHTIFWQNLSPEKSEPSKELKEAIEKQFKSFDNFKKELTALTVGVQGSGWGWLGYNKKNGKLQLVACANQDPLEATTGLIPLFGIDVWEHAYYLQYKNVRPSYVEAIFEIANWKDVSNRFVCAK